RALGLAARALHDAATAARHLRASAALAGRHRLAPLVAEARMSLALILDDLGRPAAALSEIDRALLNLRGHRRARATMQRSLILRRLGHDAAALAGYRAALRMFRRHGDRVWEARTLTNRGVLHGYRGSLRMAEADLREAQALYTRLGMSTAAAQVEHNLGFVAAQSGDVPTALAHYDRAQAKLWNTGVDAVSLLDRAELLLAVHLLAEARSAVQEAIAGCEQGRLDSVLGQAYLMLAQVELLADAPARSRAAASAARRIFSRQRRAIWVARARRAELAAVVREGRADRGTLRDLRTVAAVLLDAGWPQPGWDALLDAAALAARLGEWHTARELLVGLEPVARAAPASQRIRLWHVRALVGLGTGDLAQARRAEAAGLRQAEDYQATLGATELRAGAGWQGAALAELRLRLALEHGRPAEALLWSQRGRSAALWLPPARPSADPVVA
ncbi:ATP-binding protein, partial [Rugosimonospora acidiphila]